MLIYAFLTEQFVVDLFLAGVVSGILPIAIYFLAIKLVVSRKPELARPGEPSELASDWPGSVVKRGIMSIVFIYDGWTLRGYFTLLRPQQRAL